MPSDHFSPSQNEKLETIQIDIGKAFDTFDFSSLIDTSIMIVPFENSDSCLIGEVTDLLLQNEKIFVIDNQTKTVFIFNLQGQFLSKICKIGRGSGEYLGITACTVIDSTIIIYDHISRKVNRYNMQGQFLGKISFDGWGASLFSIGNKLYFVNDWSSSEEGYYRLFSLNIPNNQLEKFIPFTKSDSRGWGIDRSYAISGDTALIFYSSCDTIYSVTTKNVVPKYYVDFIKKKLPKEIATGDGREALITSMKGDYITGVNSLTSSDNFIFLQYRDKSSPYISIYDKKNKHVMTCRNMILGQNGNINLYRFKIEQDMILSVTSASDFKLRYEYTYSQAKYFSSLRFKQSIEHLNQTLKDDSNPILFIYQIKKSAHINL